MSQNKPRLLLIDDDSGQLDQLHTKICEKLGGDEFTIDVWRPAYDDQVRDRLAAALDPRPVLVVTDHDLTAGGPPGLFGGTIISWFRAHAIPVGDYSRKLREDLEEPEMFDFRFNSAPEDAAGEIVDLFLGFRQLEDLLGKQPLDEIDSWSQSLALALGKEQTASSFSLYSVRAGASHVDLIDRLEQSFGRDEALRLLQTYVLGHLLRNGILRYAGPLMNERVLCSYLAVSDDHGDKLAEIFAAAAYDGPFSSQSRFFWHEDVDEILVDLAEAANIDGDIGDDEFRRSVMERHLDPGLHGCQRCGGSRGGFRCPYTDRTTCDRPDCSVTASSFVPQGAYLTRVEKDYYERLAPLLGL